MRKFSNKITLVKNSRGVYDLDVCKGCYSGIKNNPDGCYNDCYAARYAKRYGYDFGKTILRYFENDRHRKKIIRAINKSDMPFIRIGVTGDPSECWEHTLNICESISQVSRKIIIITKHWFNLTVEQLERLHKLDICVNTSVSALDKPSELSNRLKQYNRLKKYCISVLRIVSCNFNLSNKVGIRFNKIQKRLFKNKNIIDTILRVSLKNKYVLNGILNIEKITFLRNTCWASRYDKSTYLGVCGGCKELCGLSINGDGVDIKYLLNNLQLKLF